MTAQEFDPRAIKAIVTDLDGTLLRDDKTISERTHYALKACMERGIKIIVATGRGVVSGERFRKQIGVSGPHIYYNGAEVVDADAEKIIYTHFAGPEPIQLCVQLARQKGLFFQVYFPAGTPGLPGESNSGEILMADHLTPEGEDYQKSAGINIVIGDLAEQLTKARSVIKAMFITPEENHAEIRSLLTEKFGESLYVVRTTPVFLEILAAGVSKGVGLEHALSYLNLKPENTLAFGDEENDLPMLRTAGFSAAPANAKESVHSTAMFHIPSNNEDGIAAFLEERFGL